MLMIIATTAISVTSLVLFIALLMSRENASTLKWKLEAAWRENKDDRESRNKIIDKERGERIAAQCCVQRVCMERDFWRGQAVNMGYPVTTDRDPEE